jgi:hypothetical protein
MMNILACISIITSLVNNTYPDLRNSYVNRVVTNVCKYSERRGLDPLLVSALISHESAFKSRAKSRTNDIGLMQLNKKFIMAKCNPWGIRCNIAEGTRQLAGWKKRYSGGKHHWLRRYNWRNRDHHLRILWVREAYKKILDGHTYLYDIIRSRKYCRIKINLLCIGKNLCGQL